MALVVTIGGINRTPVTVAGSVYVEQRAADFISVCGLRIVDVGAAINIAAEAAILLDDDISGEVFFNGRVIDIRYTLFGECASRYIDLKCQDLSYQLNETVIDQIEVFDGVEHGGITADDDIIDNLFTEYLPAVDSVAHVDVLQDPLTITFNPCTLRNMLSQICTRTGGYFYIDFDNELHYFDAEAVGVGWFLSDTPVPPASYSYLLQDLNMATTATTVLEGVFVIGSEVSGWRGIHAPGDRQGIARDNRITTAQGVIDRGDAILGKYGAAQVVYTVATYQAGLRAGYDVRFVCGIYGVDDTFTVRKMIVRWDGCGTPYYTLTLGAVVNPSLISERSWIDGLTDSVTITAPMLPTSSRGWTQNLVFSATDHNTVAWAGGGTIILADGTVYTINAGNTGNMVAITYIYLDLDVADNALQTTDDAAVAVGSRILLVAVAQDVADAAKDAIFQTFGGEGQGVLVTADHIAAGTVTANEIAANTILAGNIAAGAIETDELAALAVTAAKIAANTITADKINMGIGDGLFNAADGLLLLGPHCEINTTEWWTARKQKATLSGAFHQESGRWLGTRGLVVEEATTNLITNPSIEIDTTSWVFNGATISRDTAYSVFGSAALKIVTDNAAGAEGAKFDVTAVTAADTEYTLSIYARGSGTIRLSIWDANGGHQYSSVFTLTDVWTRYQLTATYSDGVARWFTVYTDVQQDITFYVDGAQLEEQGYATSYTDGTLGTGYAWTGAAHASTSTRTITEVNLDAHVGLITANAALSFRILAQMPYDADATWPHATGLYLFDVYSVSDRLILIYRPNEDKFGVWIDGSYRLVSDVQTFKAGDWLDIIVTLDFTADDYNLYINGELEDNDTTALAAQVATQWNLGSAYDTTRTGGFVFAEYSAFDEVLTAIEVAGMYALQRPMIDMGSLDKPGLYILDGQFSIMSSTSGNRIEITASAITGYDSGGTAQFYLSAADGVAYAGAGAVVLDATGLYLWGTGITGDPRKLRFIYDDAGTDRHMGSVYGNYGGPGPTYTWLTALRVAGDPWTSSTVIIQADDDVAAVDLRITLQTSDDTIHIGGSAIYMAGDIHVSSGVIEFTPVSGDNVINIANNVADALHITDAGALEILRIVTTGGAEAIAIDPAGGTVSLGIGMLPTADSLFCVNLPTQNFELMNAGVAGATEQAWVEVEIGGVQGWLRVYAGT